MKKISMIIKTRLFFIILLFVTQISAATTAGRTYRIGIASRIEFAPMILDMIREDVSAKLSPLTTSLSFIPLDDFSTPDFKSDFDYILVENGLMTEIISQSHTDSGMRIVVAWVLAVRGEAAKKNGNSFNTLQHFIETLKELKLKAPHKFPWFEPLCSKTVLRNFCHILGEAGTDKSDKSPGRPIWEEPSAAGVLYRSIEEGLLNPMSVEADLTLANSVFAMNDTFFSSTWVPLPRLLKNAGKENDVSLLPFPALNDSGKVPTITLALWHRTDSIPIASHAAGLNEHESESLIELDFVSDSQWFSNKFQDQYDRLIMGDF